MCPLEFGHGRRSSSPPDLPSTRPRSGKAFTPAFVSVWVGVTLYTAAFIGEIVRAGIMAVHRGQNEAAPAAWPQAEQVLRLVVLPQAFRSCYRRWARST